MRLLVPLLAALALVAYAAPAASQTTSTTTTTVVEPEPPAEGGEGGGEVDPDELDPTDAEQFQLPPLDPEVVASARTTGEQTAVAIRSRIRELAQARVDLAREASVEALAVLDGAAAEVYGLATRVVSQGKDLDQAQVAHRAVTSAYRDARLQVGNRAAALYIRGSLVDVNDLLEGRDPLSVMTRVVFIGRVLDEDRGLLKGTYDAAVAQGDSGIPAMVGNLTGERNVLDGLRGQQTIADEIYGASLVDLVGVLNLNLEFIFPVMRGYQFGDSFLAPRMFGTPDAHRHQGADIFAPFGTPVVAVERGIVTRIGTVRLGGQRVWLIGETGTAYYYAHLSRFGLGLEDGDFVEAGTVLGYVGDTGNARGTPPHLHFEIRPGGGSAVNPTPLLRQTSEETGADS